MATDSSIMTKYFIKLFTVILGIVVSLVSFSQDKGTPVQIHNPGPQFQLVGKLGEKFGTTLTVKGIIVDGPSKGHRGGPNLRVQMINDKATQHLIQIPLSPYFGKFGEAPLPQLKNGSTYSLRVYETGEFVGVPSDAYQEAGMMLQTSGFYFQNKLIVISAEKISPIEWSPVDFLGQDALLSGIASNENDTAVIQTSKWKLQLPGCNKWTESEIGKPAEVYGKIQETATKFTYNVENCQSGLVRLEDQLGKTVRLRGRAMSMNGYWWFNYRGTDIYIENMAQMPNWTTNNHFRSMEITGTLEQAELPDIDQITLKANPDRKLYYIVRKASWIPIELLVPELPLQD